MACPEVKLSPLCGTPRKIASGTVVPGRCRCTSCLATCSRTSFKGTTSTSAAASRQRRHTSAPAANTSGTASTPRYWAASIGRYSQPGSPLTAWNTARSAGPTRPSAAITAQMANTARLAASTMRSRRMRLTTRSPPAVPARMAPQGQTAAGRLGRRSSFPSARRASGRTTAAARGQGHRAHPRF